MNENTKEYAEEMLRLIVFHSCKSSYNTCQMIDEHDITINQISQVEQSLELALNIAQSLKKMVVSQFKEDFERQI